MKVDHVVRWHGRAYLPDTVPEAARAEMRTYMVPFVRELQMTMRTIADARLLIPLAYPAGTWDFWAARRRVRDLGVISANDEPPALISLWPRHPWFLRSPLALFQVRGEARAIERIWCQMGPPDLVHAHFLFSTGCAVARAARARNLPFVVTVHESYLEQTARWRHLKSEMSRALQAAARILAVSSFQRDRIVQLFPACAPRTVVVPNGVDTDRFTPRESVRKSGPVRLAFVGNLVPGKDLPVLLNALSELDAQDLLYELDVLGEGLLRPELEARARTLKGKVRFHGAQEREAVARHLHDETDLLVVSSLMETFSIVCIEALASGVPVVATDCGGPRDIITPEVGRLVPPGQSSSMAAAIKEVWNRRFDYNPRRLAEFAKERFSLRRIAERTCELYREAIKANDHHVKGRS